MSKLPVGTAAVPVSEDRAVRDSIENDNGMHVLCIVEGLATAEVGRTCLLLWRGVVTEPRFQIQREAMEHVTSRYPGESNILCVIEPTSEPPSQELREAASKLLTSLGPKLRCVAYVIEGSGFRAAMIRGVLSSIELLRRGKSYSARYFATVGQAAAWIGAETASKSLGLAEATDRLRARMDSLSNDQTLGRGAPPSWLGRS